MIKIFGFAICGLTLAACQTTSSLSMAEQQALDQQAQQIADQFGQQLLGTVQQAMQHGGTTSAIAACQQLAPALAAQASQQGWQVGRTSLKWRNANNQPDAWQQKILQQFAQQLAAGQPMTTLKASTVERGEYRYMQAIAIKPPCLACHGTALDADTQQALNRLYPDDRATGYQLGELRGAFVVSRQLRD
jgi:hypothetical protein